MNKGVEGIAEDMTKAYQFDWTSPLDLGVRNRVYEEINRQHDNTQKAVGRRAATADNNLQRQHNSSEPRQASVFTSGGIQIERSSSSSSKRSGSSYNDQIKKRNQQIKAYNDEVRKKRNADIERHNQEVRAHNAEIERRRRQEEQARKEMLFNKGYTQSLYSHEGSYLNSHTRIEEQKAIAKELDNNHEADGFVRRNGYVNSSNNSNFTKKRSFNFFPKKPNNSANNHQSDYLVPITQMSVSTSSDFLNIEHEMNKKYHAITRTREFTWEWVKEHPEDSWKWIKQQAYKIDDFLDYELAIENNNNGFFTQSVRKLYNDSKMLWYNNDISYKIESNLNKITDASPEGIRQLLSNKTLDYLQNDGLKPIPAAVELVNEKTHFYMPSINMNSVEDAKDLINLTKSTTKDSKSFISRAADAIYRGNEQQYLNSEDPSEKIAQETASTSGKIAERRIGTNPIKPYLSAQETYKNAMKKTDGLSDKKEKQEKFSREFIKQNVMQKKEKVKSAIKDETIKEFKTNFLNAL